jgi:hypothetical protein
MIGLRSIRLIALGLAVVCCSATALAASDSWTVSPSAAHRDGGRCPDSGPDGTPCETGCACVCCPGQVPVSLLHETGMGLGALTVCRRPALPSDGLQSDDPTRSIFHPPRRLTPA